MKLKTIAVLLLGVLATFATGVKAQVASTVPAGIAGSIPMPDGMVHDVTPFGQISGKDNPEKITSDVAFRLLMNDLFTRSDANSQGVVFDGLLNQIGLNQSDSYILRATVISYNKNLDTIVSANNSAVGGSTTFWRDVYALVYNTRLGLNIQLSAEGNNTFAAYLEVHKQYLSVSPFDIGNGDSSLLNLKEVGMVASAAGRVPQGMQMTPNYSKSSFSILNFPAVYVNNAAFWTGWAQDTGSGTEGFMGYSGNQNQVIAETNGTLTEANAYWPAGGISVVGVSNMKVGLPSTTVNNVINSMGVRTNISSNGNNYYAAYLDSNNYIYLYSYRNNVAALLGSWQLPSALSASFQSGDQLTLITINSHINVIYTPANAGSYNGMQMDVIDYYDSNPLPAGYVGIQEYTGGGLGTFAGWSGGTGFSITVSGSITGNTLGSGWPPSTTHTPRVVNTKGTLGSTITGNAVSPSSYVGLTNQQTYSWEVNGVFTAPDLDNIIVGAYVFCTQVGTFFQVSGSPFVEATSPDGSSQYYGDWVPCWAPRPGDNAPGCGGALNFVWLAITYLHTKTFDTTTNTYTAALNCTSNTSPPDAAPGPSTIIQNWLYRVQNWRYFAVCVSSPLGENANHFSCYAIDSNANAFPLKVAPKWNPMPAADLDIIEIIKGHSTQQYCTHHANTATSINPPQP